MTTNWHFYYNKLMNNNLLLQQAVFIQLCCILSFDYQFHCSNVQTPRP